MSTETVSRKRPSKKRDGDAETTKAVRMSTTYADWLERFANKKRVNVASLIDIALAALAHAEGFEEPPDRIP